MSNLAAIHALWVGEEKPDLTSKLIQKVIGADYSHNCFVFEHTGMLWEATFGDHEKDCGIISRPPRLALQGCIIRARKRIQLTCTNEEFEEWLDKERRKDYSHGQNAGAIWTWMQGWVDNYDKERNCSELLAAACKWSQYKFPRNLDYVKPTDTFRIIKPHVVNEVVDKNWKFIKSHI